MNTADLRKAILKEITKILRHHDDKCKMGAHEMEANAILDAVIAALPEESIGNAFSYNQALKDVTTLLQSAKSSKDKPS